MGHDLQYLLHATHADRYVVEVTQLSRRIDASRSPAQNCLSHLRHQCSPSSAFSGERRSEELFKVTFSLLRVFYTRYNVPFSQTFFRERE
eukprot:IDg10815t1